MPTRYLLRRHGSLVRTQDSLTRSARLRAYRLVCLDWRASLNLAHRLPNLGIDQAGLLILAQSDTATLGPRPPAGLQKLACNGFDVLTNHGWSAYSQRPPRE